MNGLQGCRQSLKGEQHRWTKEESHGGGWHGSQGNKNEWIAVYSCKDATYGFVS